MVIPDSVLHFMGYFRIYNKDFMTLIKLTHLVP